jgi:hypothetical protein
MNDIIRFEDIESDTSDLKDRLAKLPKKTKVRLFLDYTHSTWVRVDRGIRPVGITYDQWPNLLRTRRGQLVQVSDPNDF